MQILMNWIVFINKLYDLCIESKLLNKNFKKIVRSPKTFNKILRVPSEVKLYSTAKNAVDLLLVISGVWTLNTLHANVSANY